MVNTHWGDVEENNHFGTHEFMALCELLGADPYVSGQRRLGHGPGDERVGRVPDALRGLADGRPQAVQRPRRAVAGPVLGRRERDVGVRRADARRDLRRPARASTPPSAGTTATTSLYRIAAGASDWDVDWTEALMRAVARAGRGRHFPVLPFQGISVHYYTIGGTWTAKGSATRFDDADYWRTIAAAREIEPLLRRAHRRDGPLRPRAEGRARSRRVGHLVGCRAGHEPRLPVPAEHHARRAGRSACTSTCSTGWPTAW